MLAFNHAMFYTDKLFDTLCVDYFVDCVTPMTYV